MTDDRTPLLRLPETLRDDLKTPMGPIETDAAVLLESIDSDTVVVTVGDVVTAHLVAAGRIPDVSLVDGRTKRSAVDDRIEDILTQTETTTLEATNPPATLTESVFEAIVCALTQPDPVTIHVDGEEDLAVLPVVLVAPDGASVIYGQPDVGMVHVTVTDERRSRARTLLEAFDGDSERALSILDSESGSAD